MTAFEDRYWSSRDGLTLHYRDYAGRDDRPPVLCLPGLTRNARDFGNVAARFGGEWRVLCLDLRGRGDSAYAKNADSYTPLQYVEDIEALLEEAGITRFVAIGTSLGGLLVAILAMKHLGRLAGAVINDIGPVIEPAGLERIRSYVGQGRSFPTWMHAARGLEETQGMAFPGFRLADWLAMAKRLMTVGQNGRIVFDYDMKIAEPFNRSGGEAEAVDLWPAFAALSGTPVLSIRGELSDILSAQTHAEMARRLPDAESLTLARIGHAPTLDEPESVAAIGRLLARIG